MANVLRTEPILIDDKGHAFWELNGYNGEPNILLQGQYMFFPLYF